MNKETPSLLLRGGTLLAGGQLAGQLLVFIRNLIIARLLGPEQFGIGATFAVTLAVIEMTSDLGSDRMLIQSADGDGPQLQATAQAVQVLRGVIIAAIVWSIAQPMALLFGVPEALWAFRTLALVPLIRGLVHLDHKRYQRRLRYGPAVTVELTAQAVGLALAWPLALWTKDYSAILGVTLAHAVAFAVLSHLVAQRPYRWAWERQSVDRLFVFGWPLMVNGLFMFGIFQGDRLVIGARYSMYELGAYAVAFSLTMAPTLALAKINAALILPVLAECRDNPARRTARYETAMHLLAALAGVTAAGFILLGGAAVVFLYGSAYAPAAGFIGWMGAMQAVRLLRSGPSQAAMAAGETRNTMIANAVRSLALVGMLVAAAWRAELVWLVVCGLAGEVMAMTASTWLLNWQQRIGAGSSVRPALFAAGLMVSAAGVSAVGLAPWGRACAWAVIVAVAAAGCVHQRHAAVAGCDFGFRISDFGFGTWSPASTDKSEVRNPKSEIRPTPFFK